jgi:hypothetical protein
MINDLTTPTTTFCESLWKYVDDTTLSETISKKDQIRIQESVDAVQACVGISNMAELNEKKCKELRTDFSREPTENTSLHPIFINHKEIEVVIVMQKPLVLPSAMTLNGKCISITLYQKLANVYI